MSTYVQFFTKISVDPRDPIFTENFDGSPIHVPRVGEMIEINGAWWWVKLISHRYTMTDCSTHYVRVFLTKENPRSEELSW